MTNCFAATFVVCCISSSAFGIDRSPVNVFQGSLRGSSVSGQASRNKNEEKFSVTFYLISDDNGYELSSNGNNDSVILMWNNGRRKYMRIYKNENALRYAYLGGDNQIGQGMIRDFFTENWIPFRGVCRNPHRLDNALLGPYISFRFEGNGSTYFHVSGSMRRNAVISKSAHSVSNSTDDLEAMLTSKGYTLLPNN